LELQGDFNPVIGLPLDTAYRPTQLPDPPLLALYQRQGQETGMAYAFTGFRPINNQLLTIEFVEGPYSGMRSMGEIRLEAHVPLTAQGALHAGEGDPAAVAVYSLAQTNGTWCYRLDRIDDSDELVGEAIAQAHEHRLSQVIRNFYHAPNYDIYSMKPTGEHTQVPVEVGWRRGHVDEGIAALIAAAWKLGLDTIGSCQCRPPGTKFEGQAYIGFFRHSDAESFHQWLSDSGIASTLQDTQGSIAKLDDAGRPMGEAAAYTNANVFFDPPVIAHITEVLQRIQPLRS
jgi:hypothetical protein